MSYEDRLVNTIRYLLYEDKIGFLHPVSHCKYLELIPSEDKKGFIEGCRKEVNKEDIDIEDIKDYYPILARQEYYPHCKKNNRPCVICEKPIKPEENNNLHSPFHFFMRYAERIEKCEDREFKGKPHISAYEFLFKHIKSIS